MPTLFIIHGFRFFFFSNEGNEPIHIHVEKGEKHAKFWIHPVSLEKSYRFSSIELTRVKDMIDAHRKEIEEKWYEYFKIK